FSVLPRFQGRPRQSVSSSGTSPSIPSHQGQPSFVTATLVKMECARREAIAFGFVFDDVPGATPKNPASGLIAHRRPSAPRCIHPISPPTVRTLQPGCDAGGTSVARLVLPPAAGNPR